MQLILTRVWLPLLVVLAPAAAVGQSKGPCQAVPAAMAAAVLGSGARITKNERIACEYSVSADGGGTRVLALQVMSPGSREAAQRVFSDQRQGLDGTPEPGLGEGAFVMLQADVGCSGITSLKGAYLYEATLCGPGFGTAADRPRLRELMQRLLGAGAT